MKQQVLTIYWSLLSVERSDHYKGRRSYKRTRMRTDFPAHVDPVDAARSIMDEHGSRPNDGLQILHGAHKFAEIHGHRNHEVFEREKEQAIEWENQNLLTPEMMEQCKYDHS